MREYPDRWKDEWNDLPEGMRRFAAQVGPTGDHVLLHGPPGSGKGYLARILHDLSPRAEGPFVLHNCGVFTESLAESQLFGHMKGSYTGATSSKPGLIEAAARGTLFLDELGALPRSVQAMLLVFLETGEFSRLGSSAARKPDLRIVAATNRDLGAAIAEGEFRGDLVDRMLFYYEVPSLRERRGEIAAIVHRFLRENSARCELTDDAMSRLRSHDWPGNIRELQKVVRYCIRFATEGVIGLDLVEAGIRNQRVVKRPSSEGVFEPPKPKSDEVMNPPYSRGGREAGRREAVSVLDSMC